jgi:hypothetical protein
MTTSTATATKTLCPECRHENEPERIYCHECGTRLDRTAVRLKKEPVEDTHKRVKQMFDPTRAKMRAMVSEAVKLILGAGLVAILVDMGLPPDVPAPVKNRMLVSTFRFDLEAMATKHQPPRKECSEDEVNGVLASAVRRKQASLDKPFLPFKRAVVRFYEQRCDITAERSIGGYLSVYTTCSYVPELKEGHLSGKITAARIGRLAIHPKVAQYMGILLADLGPALDSDLKLLSRMGAIELHDKLLILTAKSP